MIKLKQVTIVVLTNTETGERLDIDVSGATASKFQEEISKLPFLDGVKDEKGEVRGFGKRKFGNIGIQILGGAQVCQNYPLRRLFNIVTNK